MGSYVRSDAFWRGPYFIMLVILIGIYMTSPFTGNQPGLARAGLSLATCAAMIIGVRASGCVPVFRRVTYVLAGVVVLLTAWETLDGSEHPTALARAAATVMIGTATIAILISVMRAERIDTDKINAAICGLVTIGVLFGFLYAALDLVLEAPPAFQATLERAGGAARDEREYFYFSFVTLTTLGYGDIIPSHPLTRTLSTLEALAGQMYLAVLIARLVALHILHSQQAQEAE